MSSEASDTLAAQAASTDPGVIAPAGEPARPRELRLAWALLLAIVVLEAGHDLLGLPGPTALYDDWMQSGVIAAAALLCLARAAAEPRERAAWVAFGVGMLFWCAGTVLWTILYEGNPNPPYPTAADVLWLLWYPFTAAGVLLLIRPHVAQFELHRWMDGLAVMLLVLAAVFPLTLQPVNSYLHKSPLAAIVDLSYPVLDTLLLGGILGLFGLMAWRPGRALLLVGLGCLVMAFADAAFAIQQARGHSTYSHYDFIWTAGALLIAYAAWVPKPHSHESRELVGLQAIALPLAAQVFAVALQICIVLFPAFDTETHRLVVLAVLVIATIQLVLAQPRIKRG